MYTTTNQVVDGYLVLVYQLGYVALFAIVFPLVCLCVCVCVCESERVR